MICPWEGPPQPTGTSSPGHGRHCRRVATCYQSVTTVRVSSSCSSTWMPSRSRHRACAWCACTGAPAPCVPGSRPRLNGRARASCWREPARVLVRNYRPDGSLFWNEMVVQPVRSPAGQLTHYIGYHRDASERLKGAERSQDGLPTWLREDRLTGLHSRAYFEELLQRDWVLAQRDSHEIGLTLFDIDDLGAYNDKFDRSAGDACIRRVARVVGAAYKRRGDLVGRWEGGTFAVLTQGEAADKAT